MNLIDKNTKVYYISTFLLFLASTMPHSILTVLFLKKGLLMSQIVLMQSFFNLSMIIFEIPSGVMSDLYSRKKVYILSLVTLVITFSLIIFSKSLFWLSVAYVIYGVANALETGTIDVVLINSLKNNETGLQKFLKYQKQISTFSSILGSGIGFLLYFKIGVNIYFISITLILINILLTTLFFSDENKKANENINFQIFKRHIAECISELKEKRVMKYYFIFFGIIQIFIQSHFQLWQKLFLDKGIGEKNFFVMYVLFQIIVIIAYNTNILLINMKKLYLLLILIFLMVITVVVLKNNLIFTGIYLILCTFFFIINYYFEFHFNKILSKEKISAITSMKSFFSRIFSFGTLFISSLLLRKISVVNLFVINVTVVIFVVMYLIFRINRSIRIKT